MTFYSLQEYIKDKSKDLKNVMQEGGMSTESLTTLDGLLNKHFRMKVLLHIIEQDDPYSFWIEHFDLCAYNVFKITVDVVTDKMLSEMKNSF